jgi:hypothetical protein
VNVICLFSFKYCASKITAFSVSQYDYLKNYVLSGAFNKQTIPHVVNQLIKGLAPVEIIDISGVD